MGCCLTKLSGSASAAGAAEITVDTHAVELKKLILRCPDLKQIADHYPNSILTRIIKALTDLTCRLDNALSVVLSCHAALLTYKRETEKREQNKRKKGHKKKKKHTEDVFAEVTAEIGKLKLAGAYLEARELLSALGDLNNTMDRLLVRKVAIEKRMRSTKWWRKVWSVAFTVAFICAMLAIVGLAVSGIPPMAISAATAFATGVKAVEPWIDRAWDEKEKELKDEKEIVEEMREGVLLAHELESVRPKLEKVRIYFSPLDNYVDLALREKNEAALAVVVADMVKMLGEVAREIQSLKGKASELLDAFQRAQSKLDKIIRN